MKYNMISLIGVDERVYMEGNIFLSWIWCNLKVKAMLKQ